MMIYGMAVDLSKDITIQDFVNQVDEESWKEFMPKGFTKGMFSEIAKYYDAEVFIEAGRIIRQRAKSFDSLDFIERAEKIAELFGTFKNPDKETVLTPWRVVNLQINKSVGGLNFYDDNYESVTGGATSNLHWVENGNTVAVYHKNTKIIDVNSKTGLYPLHSAISLYYQRIKENDDNYFEADRIYQEILSNNIYAVAKTPMAKTITERTLAGYRNYKTNVVFIENLTDMLKEDVTKGKETIEEVYKNVKFDVVIGNPPYQNEGVGEVARDEPIYHKFMDLSYELAEKAVLITPARFLFNAGQTPKAWNKKMLEDKHFKIVYYEQDSSNIFPNTDIKGGVVVTYYDKNKKFDNVGIFIPYEELKSIDKKVGATFDTSLSTVITGAVPYKFTELVRREVPEAENLAGKSFDIRTNALDKLNDILFFDTKPTDGFDYVKILGLFNKQRKYKWIKSVYIDVPYNFDRYKVLVPKSNGSGSFGEVLSTPVIGEPLTAHTQTFISIGAVRDREEAENILKYIKTKFSRTLLGILKVTQDNPIATWAKVPIQDFTSVSDIDWSQSIADIDQQLYRKYGLTKEEIDFIESKVKEME